jgi:hypothetical protein
MKNMLGVCLSAVLFCGCAHVNLYKDEAMKEETALRVYESKPYLMVARKGDTVETSVIHLRDETKPLYMEFVTGLGSQKLSVALQNGMLSSYGLEADSKIPELINSVTGLLKETAAAAANLKSVDADLLNEISTELEAITNNLTLGVAKVQLSPQLKQMDVIMTASNRLNDAITELAKPAASVDRDRIRNELRTAREGLASVAKTIPQNSGNPQLQEYLTLLNAAINRIDAARKKLEPPSAKQPAFELFEIILEQGAPKLRRVDEVP